VVLFGMQNTKVAPYLAAIKRILMSVMGEGAGEAFELGPLVFLVNTFITFQPGCFHAPPDLRSCSVTLAGSGKEGKADNTPRKPRLLSARK
jgi:hypothetical protein